MTFFYAGLFILCILILVKSGAVSVKKLVAISQYLRISEYILAFVLMALATSLPEFFVGITSSLSKTPILSLSNVIGSNISNLSLILGIIILISGGLSIKSRVAKKDAWIVFFISILPLLLILDKKLSQADGIILLIVFGLYMRKIFKARQVFSKRMNTMLLTTKTFQRFIKDLFIFLGATAMLLVSAWGIVETSTVLANKINLPLSLIGLFLVALGTSLPELIFGIKAIITKHEGMNLGNLMGSTVINSTLILGITALIYPIKIENFDIILTGAIFMILSILMVNIFIRTKKRISWKEGIILLGIYAVFLVVEFFLR